MKKKLALHIKDLLSRLKIKFIPSNPVSRVFGLDRGKPIDRYYIEKFIAANAHYIHGHVMEISEAVYTRMHCENVHTIDVLNIEPTDNVTLVGDLASGEGIPVNKYDCVIITQTFHVIKDVSNAISNAGNSLRPGGVLLATLPCISQISRYDMDRWGDYWRFTSLSAQYLFEKSLDNFDINVFVYGNPKATVSFIYGFSVEDLNKKVLDEYDEDYQMLVGVTAIKRKNND